MKDYRLRERRAEDDIRLKELREKYPYHIMYLDAAKKMELHQCVISRIEGLPSNSIGIRQSDKDWHGSCVSAWNGFIDSDSVSQISTEQVLSSDVTPVPASWYSGLLRISVGDVLRYAMGYFQTEFETDRIIEIAGGAARRSWIIDNKPGHEARNHVGKAEFTAPPR